MVQLVVIMTSSWANWMQTPPFNASQWCRQQSSALGPAIGEGTWLLRLLLW